MKGLKDFLYDKNDILIALAILIIAAVLIIWRMDVIMEYPHTLAEKNGTAVTTEKSAIETEQNQNSSESQKDNTADSGIWASGVLRSDITVTVAGGSATAAVQSLIDQGLFSSYEEFEQICKAAGYRPEDIKATTFTFKAGSTQTDIAGQVTA